jgi:hypothetical protein
MTWASLFLIKQAALYSPPRTIRSKTTGKPRTMELNWELGKNRARLNPNIKLVTPDSGQEAGLGERIAGKALNAFMPAHTIPTGGKHVISVNPRFRNEKMDLTLPGAASDVLAHELDEASMLPANTRVLNLRPESEQRVRENVRKIEAPGGVLSWPGKAKVYYDIHKTIGEGGVGHIDPQVLYRESNRLASGEMSPEQAAQMIKVRKSTGEYDALKRLGVQYGHQVIPEGGRAWNRLLQRQQKMLPARALEDVSMFNLQDLLQRRSNKPRRGPFSSAAPIDPALKAQIMAGLRRKLQP